MTKSDYKMVANINRKWSYTYCFSDFGYMCDLIERNIKSVCSGGNTLSQGARKYSACVKETEGIVVCSLVY